MEAMIYLLSLSLVLFGFAFKLSFSSSFKTRRFDLPPGPLSLPVIGHLHLIKPPVHRLLHRLSSRYGPIMSLKFGSRLVIVISSSSIARECFSGENDVVVSNRPRFLTARHVAYNYTTVGTAPYGDHWRNLRRICSLEILSSNRLAAFLPIRKDEIRRLLTRLSRGTKGSFVNVELQSLFSDLTFNNVVRMVSGKVYYGEGVRNREEADTFKKLVGLISENSGATHAGDYLPFLKVFGNGYERKVMEYGKAMDGFLQGLLDECRNVKDGNTMVNHLLSLQETEPEYYTDEIIKGLMLAMMLAGTDTSAVTLEWAMSNLLNHPETLKKAKSEIDSNIGQDRVIDEPDITNLPYLQNVVSETFRLHPAAPLAVPRLAERDIKVGGYDVPRDAILMVNVWAIHREPELWTEPEKFDPDRFSKFEGSDDVHRLMPFGNGRRACPGAGLAQRIVTLALGSMIQCFEWEKIAGEQIDMSEVPGMSVRKKEPLRALCKSRPIITKLLFQVEA